MPPGDGGKSGVTTRTRACCCTRGAAGRSCPDSAEVMALPSRLSHLGLVQIPLMADPANQEPDDRGDRIVAAVEPLAESDREHTNQCKHEQVRRPAVEAANPAQDAHHYEREKHSTGQAELDEGIQEIDFGPRHVNTAPGTNYVGRYRADSKRILQGLLEGSGDHLPVLRQRRLHGVKW